MCLNSFETLQFGNDGVGPFQVLFCWYFYLVLRITVAVAAAVISLSILLCMRTNTINLNSMCFFRISWAQHINISNRLWIRWSCSISYLVGSVALLKSPYLYICCSIIPSHAVCMDGPWRIVTILVHIEYVHNIVGYSSPVDENALFACTVFTHWLTRSLSRKLFTVVVVVLSPTPMFITLLLYLWLLNSRLYLCSHLFFFSCFFSFKLNSART